MGWGDEIMASGQAVAAGCTAARPAVILDRHGQPRRHPCWQGNRRIAARRTADAVSIVNGSGCRPYVDYARSTPERWAYTAWRCTPGELPWVRPDARGRGRVLIEPHIKPNASPNKQWGWQRWQALVDAAPGLPWAQMAPAGAPVLAGVEAIRTADFPAAAGVLATARAAVLPEGGLHHAAAALQVPAVVLFGGMTSPRNTGYGPETGQRSLAVDSPAALGWRVPHPACDAAWDRITVARVLATLSELLT